LKWRDLHAGPRTKRPNGGFAKELARQLPVKAIYDDAAAPATKQTGQFFEDVTKAVQLALAPVQYLAAWPDRFRNFLNKSVRQVPEERRISPAPQIMGVPRSDLRCFRTIAVT
jgi:hypothetical protein